MSRDGTEVRVRMAINLELCHGRHGASARIELGEQQGLAVARVAVRGWIDRVALRRLGQAIDDLAGRGVRELVLDCSRLRHIDFLLVAPLVESLAQFEGGSRFSRVLGLSHHLSDVFRLAGGGRFAPASGFERARPAMSLAIGTAGERPS